MRTDRDAYKALAWLALIPIGLYGLLSWVEGSFLIDFQKFSLVIMLLFTVFAFDLCLVFVKFPTDNGLAYIRRLFRGLAVGLGVYSLMAFSDEAARANDWQEYQFVLGVFATIYGIIILFHLAVLHPRKVVQKRLLLIGVKLGGMSALFAILFGLVKGLSGVQTLFFALVAQCIFVSLILPGNKKLAAALSKATPFARRVIYFMARLSFSAGITVIVMLPFTETEEQTVGTILAVFFGVFIGHWVVTRNRDERRGYQH